MTGPGGDDLADPFPARGLVRTGHDLDDVAVLERGPQRDELAVDPRADTAVSDVGMDPVGEIERRRSAWKGEDVSLRREGVDLIGIEVDLQGVHEHPGVRDLVLPLDELAQPEEIAIVAGSGQSPFLVFPVRRNPLLGDQVHLPRPDLDLERLPLIGNDRGVQRLVEVRLRHGDVILDASRNRPPHLMDDAERGVTIFHRRGDDSKGQIVVDLADVDPLPPQLLVDRMDRLDPAVHLGIDDVLLHLAVEGRANAVDDVARSLHLLVHRLAQIFELARVHVAKCQVLELILDLSHPEAVGDRSVDLHRLLGDALPPLFGEELEGPHVVQAIGQLHQDHAEVRHHGQKHLAEGLGLLLFLRDEGVAGDLGDAVDQVGDLLTKELHELLLGRQGVLKNVVQQTDGDGGLIETHVGQDVGHIEGMHEIGLARAADLSTMLQSREDVGLLEKLFVEARLIALDLVEDVFETDHDKGRV